jgi:hypothetical protein
MTAQITTIIPAFSEVPTRDDPDNFDDEADAFLGELPAHQVAMNSFGSQANALAVEVNANAVSANTNALAAAAAATQAAAVAGAGLFSASHAYAQGEGAISAVNFLTYRRKTAGTSATDPSADSANWALAFSFIGQGGASITGTTTLLASSAAAMSINMPNPGEYIVLPNATTLVTGALLFSLNNIGLYDVGVRDSTGTTLGWIRPGSNAIIGLTSNATAAGTWNISNLEKTGITAQFMRPTLTNSSSAMKVVNIDADRDAIFFGGTSLYVAIYNKTTRTWSNSATLIRSSINSSTWDACLSAANQLLVVSCDSTTGVQAVTLTLSGTSVTVNTATTPTAAGGNVQAATMKVIAVGASFAMIYSRATNTQCIRGISISGTTPTVSGETNLTTGSASITWMMFATGSAVLVVSATSTTLQVSPFTIAGSTVTAGTTTTATTTTNSFKAIALPSGRWAVVYQNSAVKVGIISYNSGTNTATISTVTASSTINGTSATWELAAGVAGTVLVFAHGGNQVGTCNIVTDTAGTASAGTEVTFSSSSNFSGCAFISKTAANGASCVFPYNGAMQIVTFDVSGSSPVLASITGKTSSALPPAGRNSPDNSMTGATVLINDTLRTITASDSTSFNASYTAAGPTLFRPLNFNVTGTSSAAGVAANEAWVGNTYASSTGFGVNKVEAAA